MCRFATLTTKGALKEGSEPAEALLALSLRLTGGEQERHTMINLA